MAKRKIYNTTLDPELTRGLRILAAKLGRRQNDLIEEAIRDLLKKYKDAPPYGKEACQVALKLENTAAELHFQEVMELEPGRNNTTQKVLAKMQSLNQDDKDHAERIKRFMKEKGLE